MKRTLPHLVLSYQLPLPKEALQPFVDAVSAPGLRLVVEPRPPSGPMAGIQWLLPTAVIVYLGRSYFDGFLKEAGKDHYALVKRGLGSLWHLFFSENRAARITVVGTQGKIRPDDAKYSVGISILAEASSGLHFKLLFPEDISAEGFNVATSSFLHFLERYYGGDLDVATELRLSVARYSWEYDSGLVRSRAGLLQISGSDSEKNRIHGLAFRRSLVANKPWDGAYKGLHALLASQPPDWPE